MVAPDSTSLGYIFVARPASNRWTYSWTFGDGTSATGSLVRHAYASAGSYVVCLTVSDSAGTCTSTRCDTLVASTLRGSNGGGLAPRVGAASASTASVALTVFPNPTKDQLNLIFQGGLGQASARIMDLTGRIVLTQSFRLTQGIQQETLQVENLPVGTYVLTLDKEGKKEYFRFVKQ
jgi:PKD repeat protein